MKKVIIIVVVVLSAINLKAQEKDTLNLKNAQNLADSLKIGFWKPRNTQFGINFSQAAFNNWQGGGINNWSIGALFNNRAEYYKNKGSFITDIQFQIGTINNKGQRRAKSIDRLFMEAKYAHRINPKINWFVGANFLSQFAAGVVYENDGLPTERKRTISSFLAPGYLAEGIGIEYKPVSYFVIQLGGATLRQTFVSNDKVFTDFTEYNKKDNAYGVAKGKKVLFETGFQVVAAFDKDIAKNVNLKCRYQGFLAYTPKKEDNAIDHNINLIATAKVNKYMNLNFTLLGVYDKDQIDKFQISQGFAAGLLFTL